MEEKRRVEEDMQDSLVDVGILGNFPWVPFTICILPLQLLLQGSFRQEEVKQAHHRDAQRPNIMHTLLEYFSRRTYLSGTALCTFHHHTPARPVEMPFGDKTASQDTRSPATCRPALLAVPVQPLWQKFLQKFQPI